MTHKSKLLTVRVTEKFRTRFNRKAKKYEVPASEIHRQILTAFVEDRLTIEPDKSKPRLEK